MKKVFYLSTCDTCKRIMKEVSVDESFEKQDVKSDNVTDQQYDFLRPKVDDAEELLNKRARKYKEQGLKDKTLTDADIKKLITTEYTFLKRPVFIINNEVFIGNAKKTVERLKNYLSE